MKINKEMVVTLDEADALSLQKVLGKLSDDIKEEIGISSIEQKQMLSSLFCKLSAFTESEKDNE